MIKEACIQSYDEALIAQKSGAHRIELCSQISLDGITPKKELIKKIISSIDIPIRVMIRPRTGNFDYSEYELKLMENDIAYCKRLGIEGVVFGVLNKYYSINEASTKRLVKASLISGSSKPESVIPVSSKSWASCRLYKYNCK